MVERRGHGGILSGRHGRSNPPEAATEPLASARNRADTLARTGEVREICTLQHRCGSDSWSVDGVSPLARTSRRAALLAHSVSGLGAAAARPTGDGIFSYTTGSCCISSANVIVGIDWKLNGMCDRWSWRHWSRSPALCGYLSSWCSLIWARRISVRPTVVMQ
jgi:hypothetical protein|eukprot:COSAG02_NODE_14388_length_1277_cov_1.475382_1_plen_163_part_00